MIELGILIVVVGGDMYVMCKHVNFDAIVNDWIPHKASVICIAALTSHR